MSIRISADLSIARYNSKLSSVIIRAIDDTVRYAQGAHTTDGAYWFSSPIGPIPGYPARVPSANRVHTVGSVTPSVNRLRALSSPTLRAIMQWYNGRICLVCTTVDPGYSFGIVGSSEKSIDLTAHLSVETYGMVSMDKAMTLPAEILTRKPIGRCLSVNSIVSDLDNVRNGLKETILADYFVRAYLSTALWSSTMMPEDSERSDCSYFSHGCDVDDCSLETVIGALRDCTEFQNDNDGVLERSDHPTDRDAHDFWLSRNGHGAGFFDRGTDDADTLQNAARDCGSVDLYHLGDDDAMIIYSSVDVDTVDGCTSDLSAVWS